jgi:hypothetical protein
MAWCDDGHRRTAMRESADPRHFLPDSNDRHLSKSLRFNRFAALRCDSLSFGQLDVIGLTITGTDGPSQSLRRPY